MVPGGARSRGSERRKARVAWGEEPAVEQAALAEWLAQFDRDASRWVARASEQVTGQRLGRFTSLVARLVARGYVWIKPSRRDRRTRYPRAPCLVFKPRASHDRSISSSKGSPCRMTDSRVRRPEAARISDQHPAAADPDGGRPARDHGLRSTPRSRRSTARIAASSSGVAWSQPQMCSTPCVTSSRSSSAASQCTSPV